MKHRVLFVDDEENILTAYKRTLRGGFNIFTALGGEEGLRLAAHEEPFAVVVSDMKMPEMNGADFLSSFKKQHPQTIRIMLTGNADQQTAVDAVNKGDVYRFLNKPCPPEKMTEALESAIRLYELANAEKELLSKTVKGSVAALSEVLAMSNPFVFGRIARYQELVNACALAMEVELTWQLETMTMLCLIGTVSLPDEILEAKYSSKKLSEQQKKQFMSHPAIGAEIIQKIPRLEEVAECVRYQHKFYDGTGYPDDALSGEDIPTGARILNAVICLDNLERSGQDTLTAIEVLRSKGRFDTEVLDALSLSSGASAGTEARETSVSQLTESMTLAADILTRDGRLLVCKGQKLSPSIRQRLLNFHRSKLIDEWISVVDDNDITTTSP